MTEDSSNISLPFTRDDLQILAVDDDPMQLSVVQKSLEKDGYQVLVAKNGQEALDVLNSGVKIDLILSDVMMPVMNGPQFLSAARSDPKFAQIPIVMMSSNDQYEIVFDCLSKGADDYMIKPLSPQVLKNIYANVWIKRRQNAAAAKIQHQIVESTVISRRIAELKQTFSDSFNTPLNEIVKSLEAVLVSGGVQPAAVASIQAVIVNLKGFENGEITSVARPAIPDKMQDFFATQFGVSNKAQPKVIIPTAVNAIRSHRAAPAPMVPSLQPLNLGDAMFSLDFNVWSINEKVLMNLCHDLLTAARVGVDVNSKPGEVEYFIKKCVEKFRGNPFHNFRRACESVQFIIAFNDILNKANSNILENFEIATLALSALLHDIDHPGCNNMFQVRTSSNLSMTYNDRSILENNSCSVGSHLLQDCFTFSNQEAELLTSRQIMIHSILKTDYKKLQKFITKLASRKLDLNNKVDRFDALALIVLMSDLAFAIRPWEVSGYWYDLMRDEQYLQRDTERRLGFKVAAPMDRRLNSSMASFINTHFRVIVMPVFQAGVKVFPALEEKILTALQRNLNIIEELVQVENQRPQ
ncbi:Response regulator receiver domain containing protein [Tritrichomonas foetus]|uniref:Phosphodiesterase n=1 Tax=Tritrichomonas foetus TaxID=1144522 RepID=A0A1J4KIZ9_9EUKA|nr:Response regulator receiver domain containing protein [Tritrichomonas foetus]|eukprot:OHT11311.1 Response regulator receiver domain containing protein [Tritrichomonas foetus]